MIVDNAVATVQPAAEAEGYGFRRSSIRAWGLYLVIRAVCNRSSGTWYPMR